MIPEFLSYAVEAMYSEWVDRTYYGKLIYPFWLLNAIFLWLLVFLLVFVTQLMNGIQVLQDQLPRVYDDS